MADGVLDLWRKMMKGGEAASSRGCSPDIKYPLCLSISEEKVTKWNKHLFIQDMTNANLWGSRIASGTDSDDSCSLVSFTSHITRKTLLDRIIGAVHTTQSTAGSLKQQFVALRLR